MANVEVDFNSIFRGKATKQGGSVRVTVDSELVKDYDIQDGDIIMLQILAVKKTEKVGFAKTSEYAPKRNRKGNNAPTRISTPDECLDESFLILELPIANGEVSRFTIPVDFEGVTPKTG